MRSRHPSCRQAERLAAVLAAAVVLLSGCGAVAPDAVSPLAFAAPDRVVAGPQGGVGQFVVECEFDRFRADDPIVHPGDPGASHLHQFFGAVGVDAASTVDELRASATTCDQQADTASYWAPALVAPTGVPIEPVGATAYYRAGPDVDPATVVPYPPGFTTVAGDHTALDPQPVSVVAFGCGTGVARSQEPTECGSTNLTMVVTFQDCWNGIDTRSPLVLDPDAHVSYSRAGECPPDFPVAIPQLQLTVEFPAGIDPDGLQLASGDIHTGHADFWNTWDQDKLANEVARCIHRDLVCGVSG